MTGDSMTASPAKRFILRIVCASICSVILLQSDSLRAGDVSTEGKGDLHPLTLEESNLTDELWSGEQQDVGRRIVSYYTALTKGAMEDIETHVVTSNAFAMIEGKHTNWGWSDYRDHHLKPELDGMSRVSFRFAFQHIVLENNMAYVAYLFALSPKGDPSVDYGSGRATMVLRKSEDETWRIQHIHTS